MEDLTLQEDRRCPVSRSEIHFYTRHLSKNPDPICHIFRTGCQDFSKCLPWTATELLFVYQIQIICDQKRFSRLSKGGHFSTTSGLVATCSRHALHKVFLQLGWERHSSRARLSPCATSSGRPPSSVHLRKVPNSR